MPVTGTAEPLGRVAPAVGAVICDEAGVASVDAAAVTRPAWSESGCTPMSAKRLTVACCMRTSGAALPRSWLASSPHDHCTVPAPNTSAPLEWRYRVRLCVALPGPYVDP